MNFLLTVCAAFLTYYHQVYPCHGIEFDLDAFMQNFEKSQSDLKWIRDETHKNEGKEIELADSKESGFDEEDENSVDHWYNKYRKWECSSDHGNLESQVLNGYCGVNDDNYPKHVDYMKSNDIKNTPAADPKAESKTNFEFTDTDSMLDNFNNFDNFDQGEQFDLNSDTKLSAEEKLNLEEYNEQMIPNPNFYKINNELHANDHQINNDHNDFRNELSSEFSEYPSSAGDTFTHFGNDYGTGRNVGVEDLKTKRNTRDFDVSPETNFNHLPYRELNDQDDTRKNDLSHEADYKLSKTEQESKKKIEPSTKHNPHESQIEQRIQNEDERKFGNEFTSGYKPHHEVRNSLQNEHSSETVSHYNNFKESNRPLTDFNANSRLMASNSKTDVYPRKQSIDSKTQKYPSKHRKSSQLDNEINLKISNRMMSKGLGASLPSYAVKYNQKAYRHPMNIDVENQHWKDTRNENSDDLTDFVGVQRRLLQFDYEDPTNDYPLHESSSSAVNGKESPKSGLPNTLASNGEILNTTFTNSSGTINQKGIEATTPCTTKDKQDHLKIEPITKKNQSETNNIPESGPIDSVKLQLEIKVLNGTTKVQPVADHGNIVKRSAAYDKEFGTQEAKIQGISKNSSIRDLVSGKLPNQLIQAVFQLVKENSRLNKVVGSKLNMNLADNLELNSINLFKSKQRTEKMVTKLMSSITDLIDEQITHQTCITLPSDLQSFYDKVLYVRSINARVNKMRKQKSGSVDVNKSSTKRITRSTIPDSDLHQKYKTVGKLLKQFGHLKLKDQVKIVDIKEFLENHVQLLDDLKTSNSELFRKSRSVETKNRNEDIKILDKGVSHISRQYANLLKTTKLIKSTSLTDMDGMDVIKLTAVEQLI